MTIVPEWLALLETRPNTGLGMGLTVARKLVEMQGGRIEAFSEGLGKGSEFRVYFPLKERYW